MAMLREDLLKLQARYGRIKERLKGVDDGRVEGSVSFRKGPKRNYYYLQKKDEASGKYVKEYLGEEGVGIAKAYAQNAYDRSVYRLVRKRLVQLMDSTEYAPKAIWKVGVYEKYGLQRGHRSIVSYETSQDVLDLGWVKSLIESNLL